MNLAKKLQGQQNVPEGWFKIHVSYWPATGQHILRIVFLSTNLALQLSRCNVH